MAPTTYSAPGQPIDPVYGLDQSTSRKPLALAISGNSAGLEKWLLPLVKQDFAPIRRVECSLFPLAAQLFEAMSNISFDLVIVFINPNWHETGLRPHDAQRDRELLRKLRYRFSAPLIVIHNGCAGHKEESLRAVGVDLVLPMPFDFLTLQQFLSTRFKSANSQSPPVQENRNPVDACKPLLDAATTDLFRKNAFRITGIAVDATPREVARQADQLKMLAELGQNRHAQRGYFSIKPAPGLDEIREAVQKLKDPEKRMVDEFFWFWPEEVGNSQSDPAMDAVAKGDSKSAIEIWTARENGEVPSIMAKHNLAVTYHIRALDWENYCVKNEVEAERRQKIDNYWKGAFKRWQGLATDDRFWEIVTARIRQKNEPNLPTGFARRMRATLAQALVKINAELALAFAESGKIALARLHIRFMRETNQGPDNVEKTAQLVLTPTRNRLKDQIQRAEERAKKNPQDTASAAKELLHQAQCAAFLFDLFFGKESDFRNDLFDEVATVCNRLQIVYYKATGDDKTCLEILKLVLPFATSTDLEQSIEKDINETSTRLELEPAYTLLKSIQDSKEHPHAQLDKFERTVVAAIDTAVRGLADGSNEKSQLFESAAIVLRGVSLEAWNKHQDGTAAIAANLLALRYACTADLKRRLAEDKTTLAQNVTQQNAQRRRNVLRPLAAIGVIFAVALVGAFFSNDSSSPRASSTGNSPSYTSSLGSGRSNTSTKNEEQSRVPSSVANAFDQEKTAIESERATLEAFEAQFDSLGREIEGERLYLDQTNPYTVQQFNAKINRYNALIQQNKTATAVLNTKVDNYNAKLRQYGR